MNMEIRGGSSDSRKFPGLFLFAVSLMLLFTLAAASPEISLVQSRRTPLISRVIYQRLKDTPDRKIKAWIYFTDKDIFTLEEYDSALVEVRRRMLEKVKWRRRKARLQSADFRDISVCPQYIRAVLETGVKHRVTSRWLNAISVEAELQQLREIASLPFIRKIDLVLSGKRIEPDQESVGEEYRLLRDSLSYGQSYTQLDQIDVTAAHSAGYNGEGVLILMLDTGFYKDHQSIHSEQIVAEWDFINQDGNTQNESDDPAGQHNHGTYTLSVIGGSYPGQLYGPAYGANFLLAKTEDISQENPIEEDWYVAGLEWGDSLGADLASSSLGYIDWYNFEDLDGNTAVTTVAVDLAVSRGIICVTAAGNEGSNGIIAPADADSVISCGAVNQNGEIASFSSRGPTADGRTKPELVAMGVSTFCATAGSPDSYGYRNGTSLSTPLVAGAAAVVLSAHPDWSPMMVREALLATANNAPNPDNTYGYGLPDVMAAINYTYIRGDMDRDGSFTVLDIIRITNIILDINDNPDEYSLWAADLNQDQEINISDIVILVDLILSYP